MENTQQSNRVYGQTEFLHYAIRNPFKRKMSDSGEYNGANASQKCQKEEQREYFDYDKTQGEEDWTRSITFAYKKKPLGMLDDLKCKMGPRKPKEAQPCTSVTTANGNSDGANERPVASSVPKDKKKTKLGALCHIRVKRKKKKHRKKQPYESLRKKKNDKSDIPPCKFFLEGNCAKGDDCEFYHPSPKRIGLCKFYLLGQCAKGKDCHYLHEEFPCKYYHTGNLCYAQDKCKFSHKPLTKETREMLDNYLKGIYNKKDALAKEESEQHKATEKSEFKVKRPALLGSPSSELMESEETQKWQEEMKRLTEQTTIGRSAFEIKVSPIKKVEVTSPSKFSRPSFYADTLLRSPSPEKVSLSAEMSDSVSLSSSNPCDVPNQPPPTEEGIENYWSSVYDSVKKSSEPSGNANYWSSMCNSVKKSSEPSGNANYWSSMCDSVKKLSEPSGNASASVKSFPGTADVQKSLRCGVEEKDPLSESSKPAGESEEVPLQTTISQYYYSSQVEDSAKRSSEEVGHPRYFTAVNTPDFWHSPEIMSPIHGEIRHPQHLTAVNIPDWCHSPVITSSPIRIHNYSPSSQSEQHNQKIVSSDETVACRTAPDEVGKKICEPHNGESTAFCSNSEKVGDYDNGFNEKKSRCGREEEEASHNSSSKEADVLSSEKGQKDDGSISAGEKSNDGSSSEKSGSNQPLDVENPYQMPSAKHKGSSPPAAAPIRLSILQIIKASRQKSIAYHHKKAQLEKGVSKCAPEFTSASVKTFVKNQRSSGIKLTEQQPNLDKCHGTRKDFPTSNAHVQKSPYFENKVQKEPVKKFLNFPQPSVCVGKRNAIASSSLGNQFHNGQQDICSVLQNQSPVGVVKGLSCFEPDPTYAKTSFKEAASYAIRDVRE